MDVFWLYTHIESMSQITKDSNLNLEIYSGTKSWNGYIMLMHKITA